MPMNKVFDALSHPIRREVLEAQRAEGVAGEAAVFASLEAKLEKIRARHAAARDGGPEPD